jgi:hypothetical protein
MNFQHKDLAAGRWQKLSFLEQMANVGGEVERALNWQVKNHTDYAQAAAGRALELLDLTLDSAWGFTRLRETARVREVLVDYFFGDNRYQSNEVLWRKYFLGFAYAVRKDR